MYGRETGKAEENCVHGGVLSHVILDKVGDTGVVYRVQPEQGGREQTMHRNALKLCTAPPTDVLPPPSESETDSQRLIETPRLPKPLFYGFLPCSHAHAPAGWRAGSRATTFHSA